MIRLERKQQILDAVNVAYEAGARLKVICEHLKLSSRCLQRWSKSLRADERKGSSRKVSHKLSIEERQLVLDTANSPRFRDMYPHEIVALLADESQYIASESTFYRILREERMLSHRRKSKAPVRREKPRLKATGPNQVYSWDITYIKSNISGIYHYLYLVMDIWSRKIVAWEIHSTETSANAATMLHDLSSKSYVRGIQLHSDNGSPMKGLSMLAMMQQLGVIPSFSRPRVSTDNPYSESLFRTMKYVPTYPGSFTDIESARVWVEQFVNYYNKEHLHSGISFVTPNQRHFGDDIEILANRRQTYEEAYARNPARWSNGPKKWPQQKVVYINPVNESLSLDKAS
jgi:transposase InsO family protein